MKNFTISSVLVFLFSFQVDAQNQNVSNPQDRTLPPLTCTAPIDPSWAGLTSKTRSIPPRVRVAYLIPSNRSPQEKGVEALQRIVLSLSEFLRDEMAHSGFSPKTFRYETEADGKTPLIHLVDIPETDVQIESDAWRNKINAAMNAGLGVWQRGQVWLLVSESHLQQPDGSIEVGGALGGSFGTADDPGVGTIPSHVLSLIGSDGLTDNRDYHGLIFPEIGPYPLQQNISFFPGDGRTVSSITSVMIGAGWHELMHALQIGPHDFRNDNNFHGNLMGNGFRGIRGYLHQDGYPEDYTRLAFATANALDNNHYFNEGKQRNGIDGFSLSPFSATPQNGKLLINVNAHDADGLSLIRLLSPSNDPRYSFCDLHTEKQLSSVNFDGQIEMPYFDPGIETKYVVQVYDKQGNKVEDNFYITPEAGSNRAPWPYMRFWPPIGESGTTFLLDAANSRDPEGNAQMTFEWELDNDGVFDTPPDQTNPFLTTNFPAGNHLVRVKVTDPSGAFTISTPMALHVSGETPPQSEISFTLINADTDEDLFELTDGMQIDMDKLPTLNLDIRANTTADVESVRLSIISSGNVREINNTRTESLLPYAFFQDLPVGDYMGATFFDAFFNISAVPYSQDNLGGVAGAPIELTFEIAGYCQEATDRSDVFVTSADCNGQGGSAELVTTLEISDDDAPYWEYSGGGYTYIGEIEPGTYQVSVGSEPGCTKTLEYTIEIDANNCPDPNDFSLRINTGGDEVTYEGNTFMADSYFDSGSTLVRPHTGLPEPYQSFRYGPSQQMGYDIPVPDGEYAVNLHFAELWFGATGGGAGGEGSRIFDIRIEDKLVEDNLDVFAEAGAEAMLVKSHTVTVTDGVLDIDFSSLESDGGKRHPIINAIEITSIERPFITTWKTDNPGISDDNQITIPTHPDKIYDYTVNWGDGTFSENVRGNITHSYPRPGTYTVSITGQFPAIYLNDELDTFKFVNVEQWGDIEWGTMNAAFYSARFTKINATDIPNLSGVEDMTGMFFTCLDLEEVPNIDQWNVSNVRDMSGLFKSARKFNQAIGSWDVSQVTDMTGMFDNTNLSTENYDATLIGWSSLSSLQNGVIFDAGDSQYCLSEDARQKLIDDYNWSINDGGKVANCTDFALRINAGGEATSYNGETYMADAYFNTGRTLVRPQTGLPEPYRSFRFSPLRKMSYDIPVPDGEYTVKLHFAELWFGATDGGLPGAGRRVFDVSIEGELAEDNLDIFAEVGAEVMLVKTHNVTVAGGLLNIKFDSRDAVGGERHPVINAIEILGPDSTNERPFITTWKTDNVGISADNQITIPTVDAETYNYSVDWGDGTTSENVTGKITHTYAIPGTYNVSIAGDFPRLQFFPDSGQETDYGKLLYVNQWGDIEWTSMFSAFMACPNLDVIATDLPNLSKVNSMSYMFSACNGLVGNDAFNEWDVSNVTDMSWMFSETNVFNQDIGDWSVSKVTNMEGMFSGSKIFNKDIGGWDVSGVSDMNHMFTAAENFNQYIGDWNVSNVTDMSWMFYKADAFNQDIGDWNVSNVTSISYMFSDTNAFNQDIGDWDVSNVLIMLNLFRDAGLSNENYDKSLIGWSQLPSLQNGVRLDAPQNQYCDAEQARQQIIDTYGWIINDAGKSEDCVDLQGFTLRINTGGSEADYNGETFIADSYFDTGRTFDRPQTGLLEPFQNFRFSPSQQMSYDIPVPDGEYTVNLYFAELWFGATDGGLPGAGRRVFDVNIEGELAEDNLDIFAEVGAEAMLVKTHTTTVTDGNLDVDFSSLASEGGVRHPIINAIEILGDNNGVPVTLTLKELRSDNAMHIAPNPVATSTSLSFENPVQLREIQVFDVMGRLVLSYKGKAVTGRTTFILETEKLTTGSYFVNTYDTQGNRYQKQLAIKKQ